MNQETKGKNASPPICQEPPVRDWWHEDATHRVILERYQNFTSDSNHLSQTSGILKFKNKKIFNRFIMKNKFLFASVILTLFIILFLSIASAAANSCNPTIKLTSQDPNPAVPNEYIKVVFEVSNLGECNGYAVRLNPEYPFSLDSNSSAVQTIETNPYAPGYRNVWTIPYKIRIDSAALDGDYNLKLQYHEKSSETFDTYAEKNFNVTIKDSRTNFDAVIQEISGSDISIAIANTGKYVANSVVVRIPEQESFRVTGTDGQMVGNLASGDYTVVGFAVSSTKAISRNSTRANPATTPAISNNPVSNKLRFDIYYTDNIGERRIVNMELLLNMGNSTAFASGNFAGRRTSQTTSHWYSSWIMWIVTLAVLAGLYAAYRKYPKQFKDFLNKIKSKIKISKEEEAIAQDIHKIPDWVRNAKEKEKKK